jgi:hypothetical protein
MSQWWIKNNSNLPSIDDEQKKSVEYVTGRNPLFLSFLPGSEKSFEDALDRLKKKLIEKIEKPMMYFSDVIKTERWDMYVFLVYFAINKLYEN